MELCTLIFPEKFGCPNSRPIPEYIRQLNSLGQTSGETLFESQEYAPCHEDYNDLPHVRITEQDYQHNPLASDVCFWGHWVIEQTQREIGSLYPHDRDGGIPVAYLWARTVKCPNPVCGATIPLVHQFWLSQRSQPKKALRVIPVSSSKLCRFEIVEGSAIDFDPTSGTMRRGSAECPFCQMVANSKYLQTEGNSGRIGQQLMAVVTIRSGQTGKQYRIATEKDQNIYHRATQTLNIAKNHMGDRIVPHEPLKAWSGVLNAPLFGMSKWGDLFNDRQALALITLVDCVHQALARIENFHDSDYSKAVGTYLALLVDKHADQNSSLERWHSRNQQVANTFSRQSLPMVWDYCEVNPFSGSTGSLNGSIDAIFKYPPLQKPISHGDLPIVQQGTAMRLAMDDSSVAAVITDPPYYDAIPYADLSDFFYVWLKRTLGGLYPELFRTPLTPKTEEIVSHLGNNYPGRVKTASDYENAIQQAFAEMRRVLLANGICCVMFAHKTTSAWESLIAALNGSGIVVTSSWPFHSEMKSRLRGQTSAALASSVTLVCRKRSENAGEGFWDDVRQELKQIAQERLDFFWNEGIRGADFFISAIGPALSVFGKYKRVTKLSGEEVTVSQFLDEVRSFVTNYALAKILKITHTAAIDSESRFYVMWKWSYDDAKVPADESFKLSQALGMHTEAMWDRTGVLEKSGENVQAVPISKRMRVRDLGEPTANGSPASLIDVLHRLCAFREKGDTQGMSQFLGQSGQANNPTLWLMAQAMSEILPDGDKEKQLMQGLLNQREGLAEATQQRALF